ncbi:MAG: amidase [Caulobacterales bacterium 32-69-10]|nr:MAG: amidase [Caulobacterales bacterium 32-69-10]
MNRSGGLARLDATAQLKALETRRLSAAELLEASVATADAAKSLNAVVRRDLDRARQKARSIDERRHAGETAEALGLLAGLPMTVKDTLDVDGMAATAGTKALQGRAAGDAAAVGRVRTEGAVIWGKTNTPALADDFQTSNALYGTTRNPWDEALTPGGSSGGAAAALAAGVTPLEIGSDLAGSLRIPASFCGVFAHKPTYGLVSQRGHTPPAPGTAAEPDLNVIGPMARSARDLRLLLSIMAQAPMPAKAAPVALPDLKVGLWLEEPAFALDAEVGAVVEAFAGALGAAGTSVLRIESPVDPERLLDTFAVLMYAASDEGREALWLRPAAKLARGLGATRTSWAGTLLARTVRHREWMRSNEARARMGLAMAAAFSRYDVIVAPAAPCTAFPHDPKSRRRRKVRRADGRSFPYGALMDWSALASACGLPATVVPAGLSAGGLPVGVQIIGPRGADSKTLAVAQAIEENLGGFTSPPG